MRSLGQQGETGCVDGVEGFRLPIIQAASSNQNVSNDVSHKKPEEWLPCLAYSSTLSSMHSNRANNGVFRKKKKKEEEEKGTRSLMTRDISCNETMQSYIIWPLDSDSSSRIPPTSSKACENVTIGGGASGPDPQSDSVRRLGLIRSVAVAADQWNRVSTSYSHSDWSNPT